MGKNIIKGKSASSGDPKALCALADDNAINPIETLIENDDILRKYSEEALSIIVEYHKDKMKAAREAAQAESSEIVSAAKTEAERILGEARRQADALARDSAANARKAAEREIETVKAAARDEVVREFAGAIESLKAAATEIRARDVAHMQKLETEIANVVGSIAKRIVSKELSLDPSVIVSAVRASLEYFELGARIVIRISPEHYRSFSSRSDFAGKIEELGLGADRVEIVPDASIKSGGVVVSDKYVEFDYSFDRIIDEAVKEAKKNLESGERSVEV